MSGQNPSEVAVWLDAVEIGPRRRVGTLRRSGAGPRSVVSFAYDPSWLAERRAFVLDPSHELYEGDQYPPDGDIAGIFTDTAPDRWGRTLLERRETIRAREEGRRTRALGEWDFLLGVSDLLRMGALRFASPDGRFFDDDPLAIPPTARLRELEQAAREVEEPSRRPNHEAARRLALLLAPGSSLGGARPKTSFTLEDGSLWLAKFPSHNDRHDVGAWEFVLNQLARSAGIIVPDTLLLHLAGEHHTFAARRFDREGQSRRLYASAMTLTRKRDRDEASYLDIALAIADYGASATIEEDLEQMFRRVVFNVLAGHRDDHLRNHGFLRTAAGWRLSPAFDLNPLLGKSEHDLAINEGVRQPDPRLAEETAAFYRLSPAAAQRIVAEVREVVSGWRETARSLGLPADEIGLLAAAFAI